MIQTDEERRAHLSLLDVRATPRCDCGRPVDPADAADGCPLCPRCLWGDAPRPTRSEETAA